MRRAIMYFNLYVFSFTRLVRKRERNETISDHFPVQPINDGAHGAITERPLTC